jgi:hypothetical protein
MSHLRHLTVLALISLFASTANGETLIVDSFESGDMSATNEDGFAWGMNNRTSVVTEEAAVYNNRKIYNVPSGDPDWTPKSGEHSLRFRYPAGEALAEQRFEIGKAYPELWMSFWLKVPVNYAHPEVAGADNQKLFRLWMDGYGQQGDGSTIGMSFRGDGNGGSEFFAKIGGEKGRVPFISIPGDRGRWMHLVVHVKSESIPGASDGLMEAWRKWEGDSSYTQTHDLKDQLIKVSSSVKGFAAGYLMGWANAAYPVDTEFLIDDFALATSPLFSNSNAPKAPADFAIR